MKKTQTLLTKLVNFGLTASEKSEIVMFDFKCDYAKQKFGEKKLRHKYLLFFSLRKNRIHLL